jgi:hypothetical protein
MGDILHLQTLITSVDPDKPKSLHGHVLTVRVLAL